MQKHLFAILTLSSVLGGCASAQRTPTASSAAQARSRGMPSIGTKADLLREMAEEEAPAGDPEAEGDAELAETGIDANGGADAGGKDEEDVATRTAVKALEKIPVEMNQHVQKWITYFSEKDRERFQRFLLRGNQYREVVENTLEENGLPAELYYLAMIESGYRNSATSHARAAGVWQFMPRTGRGYGLDINRYVDERRDPIRATEAASKYLKDLYNVFGSWHLAMAAYNAGEYRVVGSVVRGKSRDFWTLAKQGVLPRETADYVPKFLAAVAIGQDPAKYGFEVPAGEKYPDLEAVEVPTPIRLSDVAEQAGIELAELRRINPHLPSGVTPPGGGTYELWLPTATAKLADAFRPKLASLVLKGRGAPKAAPTEVSPAVAVKNYHRVRSGETLASIARKYKVSIGFLKRVNGMGRSGKVLAGAKLRVTTREYHARRDVLRYRVRRGDSLTSIARRFGVSVRQIKENNSLRRSRVMTGQLLKIRSRDSESM